MVAAASGMARCTSSLQARPTLAVRIDSTNRAAAFPVGATRIMRGAGRPPLGEVHWDRSVGITLYTRDAVGVRLGRNDDLDLRLRRFDAVWAELAKTGEKPRVIYLDNRARPDRVTVKLASPPAPPAAEGKRT